MGDGDTQNLDLYDFWIWGAPGDLYFWNWIYQNYFEQMRKFPIVFENIIYNNGFSEFENLGISELRTRENTIAKFGKVWNDEMLFVCNCWNFWTVGVWIFENLKSCNFETLKLERRSEETKKHRHEETKKRRNWETEKRINEETTKLRNE